MLPINKLVLGTVQLGLPYGINNKSGQPSENESLLILKMAMENEVGFLDTAEAYNSAQQIIGLFHQSSSSQFNVITKFSEQSLKNYLTIDKLIDANLEILKVDCLYGYLFHDMDTYQKYFDRARFKSYKLQKKLIKVGVSVYTNEQAMIVAKDPGIDIVQLPYNLLDNMQQRQDVLHILKSHGKEVHVRSIFLQGLLLMSETSIPQKLKPLWPYIQIVNEIAGSLDISIQQLALAYALQNDMIDRVLIGVDNIMQLEQHLGFIQNALPVNGSFAKIDNITVKEKELLNPTEWSR